MVLGFTDIGVQSYDDNTVINGTTYYYVVTSTYDGIESPYSNEAMIHNQYEGFHHLRHAL